MELSRIVNSRYLDAGLASSHTCLFTLNGNGFLHMK